jgi:hypothetical protein
MTWSSGPGSWSAAADLAGVAAAGDAPHRRARLVAEALAAGLGLALILAALAANVGWFDRHFLPDMFAPRPKQMRLLILVRMIGAALALTLLLVVRPRLGRLAARTGLARLGWMAAPYVLAVIAAVCTTEAVLRSAPWRAAEEAPPDREPLRRHDPVFGWVFLPDHAGLGRPVGGRRVLYAIDKHGYRVARPGDQVDRDRPSILYTGESIVLGHGLEWRESAPAQVQALTGLQPANMAVEAYAPDQAYLRLAADLPKFRRPAAVVSIFIPSLIGRILDEDRPHLGPDLRLRPEVDRWRLATLARRLVPYRSPREIDRAVETDRAIYRATLAMAKARGVPAIILSPQFLPEPPAVQLYRRRVLDEGHIPYVLVPIRPTWIIPGNKHPDALGDRAMAQAIVARLRASNSQVQK